MDLDRYRRVTGAALILLGAIIVSGAAVRLTGSGLGCTDWPTCEEQQLVGDFGYHGWIEYGNRLITGLVSLAVVLAALGAHRLRPPRPDLLPWAWGLVAGVVGQIALGAVVVYLDLDPRLVIGHFLLSMVLLWNAVVLHHKTRSAAPDGAPANVSAAPGPTPTLTTHIRALSFAATAVLVSGTVVTGSGPHTGSLDEPIDRLPYAIPDVARLHSGLVWMLVIGTIALALRLRTGTAGATDAARTHVHVALGVMTVQGSIGYVQYALDVPEGLVAIHVAGAVALWATMMSLHLRLIPPRRLGRRPGTLRLRPGPPAGTQLPEPART